MKLGRSDYNNRIIDKDGLIPDDEPCFILRAKDVCAPKAIMTWISELILKGGDQSLAKSALNTVQEMIEWQKVHGCKLPDSKKEPKMKFIKDQVSNIINQIKTTGKGSIDELESWLIKLYGDVPDLLVILMSSDLIIQDRAVDYSKLTYSDFKLTPEDESKCYTAKLILFVSPGRIYVICDRTNDE